jgi:hypothetical protein
MLDNARKVEYFSVQVPNKPGEAFRVLSTLVSAGINLLACSGVPKGRRAEIDIVPDDARAFKSAVKKAGLAFKAEKSGFLIQGDDRPGALAENLQKLADEGINIIGIEGLSAGEGRWGAIIWVNRDDLARAGRVLGAKSR